MDKKLNNFSEIESIVSYAPAFAMSSFSGNHLNIIAMEAEQEQDPPREDPFYHDGKYLYQGVWYHQQFPVSWAMYHHFDTGPHDCQNCACYGSVEGVFVGYCANCALHFYEGGRGRGFMGDGVELDTDIARSYPSAFDTYLVGVDVTAIIPVDAIDAEEPENVEWADMEAEEPENVEAVSEFENFYNMNIVNDENEDDQIIDNSININPHYEGGYNDW